MVTHDQEEALIMADRMVVMSEGSVRQVGTQRTLYEQPADRFVAGFVGRSNLLAGQIVTPGSFRTEGGLTIACSGGAPGSAVIAVRPERVVLGPDAASFDNRIPGTVEFVSYLGASIDVHVRVSPAESIVVSQPNRFDGRVPKEGDRTEVCWQSAAAVILS
jgi:putative spermidine/putrescine transport system ATP-binding protein